MERLLKDAQALTGVKYDINNLADVYSAIHAIQEQFGITGTTMKEAETTITGSLGMVKASWQNLLTAMSGGGDLDRAINNFVYSLEKFTANIVPVIERTLLGLGQAIQRTLPMLVQTVVSALVQQIPNLVMAVYNMIVGLFKGIVLGIKALFTGGTAKATEVIKGNISGISSGASSAADNMNDVADATKKAGKEAKKSLAAFDELNILSSGASGGVENGGTTTPSVNVGGIGVGGMAEAEQQSGDVLSETVQGIKANLDYLLPTISLGLVAIGLILLAMGNIPWGIGFIIGGAYLYSVTERQEGSFDFQFIEDDLQTLAADIAEMLVAIGIILLFLGQIGHGIGFIVAGSAIYGVQEIQAEKYDTADISTKLAVIMESVSLALVGIGVMLIFFGHVALGLGFIFVGKKLLDVQEQQLSKGNVTTELQQFMKDNSGLIVGVGLALVVIGLICFCFGLLTPLTFGIFMAGAAVLATEETMNPGAIKEEITKFFKENSGLIVGVSLALLVIGIILCFTGVGIPLAIGLIVVGAAGLAAEVTLNWNYISTKVTSFLDENAGLIVGVSIALIVLGIILLFTGVGIPLAIGLIVAGGGALATEVVLNWDFIVDKVKEVWEKVKEFWNTYIAPIFTAEWWADLGKKAINGLLGVIEKGLNWIIDKINEFISGLSKIVTAVGDVIGLDLSIPKIPKVEIPRLAKGAVIPPNKQFLAVLGDQKHGTNIEAPLQTIVDAFNIALAQNVGTVSGNTEVILEIDGREFGRAVVEQGNRENRRIGTRLVIA